MCLAKLCYKQLNSGDCFRQKNPSPLCLKIKKEMKKKSLGQLQFNHLGHMDYRDNMFHEEAFQRRGRKSFFQSNTSFCKRTTPSSLYKSSSTPKRKQNSAGGTQEALNLSHKPSSAKLWLTMNTAVLFKLPQIIPIRCYLVHAINAHTCSSFTISNNH